MDITGLLLLLLLLLVVAGWLGPINDGEKEGGASAGAGANGGRGSIADGAAPRARHSLLPSLNT